MRQYLKCKDCKKPFAIETDQKIYQAGNASYYSNYESILSQYRKNGYLITSDMVCPFCQSHKIKHMGTVLKHRVTIFHEEVPCDGRCTNAQGPSCDCSCGGENHGSQKVIEVSKVVCADKATITVKA